MDLDLPLQLAETTGQLSALAALAWAWALEFVPRLGAAIAILVVGFVLARWASRLVRGVVERTRHLDPTMEPILGTVVRYGVLILFLIAALGQLGVQTASLLAVLGAAGLAIGLALQGTMQNIAAGIMLLYLRPFRAGDTVETPAVNGRVKEIGLFVTHLETADGLFLFVPNASLWNVPLKNHTRNPHRQMTIQFSASYDADADAVRSILLDLATSDPRVLTDRAPQVSIESYLDNRIVFALRAWASTATFGDVQRVLTMEAKRRLQEAGIKIPT